MSRQLVLVRDAAPDDAAALVSLWSDFSPRAAELPEAAEAEAAGAVARIASSSDERLLVGCVAEQPVGVMHLRRAPVSPILAETAVHTTHLHVLEQWRRHGVARALFEAAVTWAEEKDTGHVLAATTASSREANRFMARLGFKPIAVIRGASVPVLRAKLPAGPASVARIGSRPQPNVGRVVARRRSQRRASRSRGQ